MQIGLALIGLFLGAAVDEWRGALFGGALGYAFGELWMLSRRVSDLGRTVGEVPERCWAGAAPATRAPARETPPVARTETVSTQAFDRPAPPPVVHSTTSSTPASVSAPPMPPRPSAPTIATNEEFAPIRWVREFFTGGNTVVRVSVA